MNPQIDASTNPFIQQSPMSPASILIVEDDSTLLRVLKDNFEFSGYAVRTAADGKRALQLVGESKPDLIILDVMLPQISGFDFCKRVRGDGLTIPIIMLTAKGQESDIVLGLNLGADDYVTKPFSIDVLLARVAARLRRRKDGPEAASQIDFVFEFGDCRLDVQAHKLFQRGKEILLTPKEFRLLEFFVKHSGRCFTRDKILDEVWGEDLIVTERSVDRCINTLRSKIEHDPQNPAHVQTIRDVGYRFEM